jgi:DNA-binding CsgD family transcriptional regulator
VELFRHTDETRLIIAGHDLVNAAERLGVSVNTTRTHLQRMFDKTGVRTQPALVRALLSVASPLG